MHSRKRKRVSDEQSDGSNSCVSVQRDSCESKFSETLQKLKLTLPELKLYRCDGPTVSRVPRVTDAARRNNELNNSIAQKNSSGISSDCFDCMPLLDSTQKPRLTLSEKDKDEAAHTMCTKLYNGIRHCPDEQYAQRLSVLEQLCDAWLKNKLVLLTSLDVEEDVDLLEDLNVVQTDTARSLNFGGCATSVGYAKPPSVLIDEKEADCSSVKGKTPNTRRSRDRVVTADHDLHEEIKTGGRDNKTVRKLVEAQIMKAGSSTVSIRSVRISARKSKVQNPNSPEGHVLMKTSTPSTPVEALSPIIFPNTYAPSFSAKASPVSTPSGPSSRLSKLSTAASLQVKTSAHTSSLNASPSKPSHMTSSPLVVVQALALTSSDQSKPDNTQCKESISRGLYLKRLASGLLKSKAILPNCKTTDAHSTVDDRELNIEKVVARHKTAELRDPKSNGASDPSVSGNGKKDSVGKERKKLLGPKSKRATNTLIGTPAPGFKAVVEAGQGIKKPWGPKSRRSCSSTETPVHEIRAVIEIGQRTKSKRDAHSRKVLVSDEKDKETEARKITKKLLGPESRRVPCTSMKTPVRGRKAVVMASTKSTRSTRLSTSPAMSFQERVNPGVLASQGRKKLMGPKSACLSTSTPESDLEVPVEEVKTKDMVKKLLGPKSKRGLCSAIVNHEEVADTLSVAKKLLGPESKTTSPLLTDTPVCGGEVEVRNVEETGNERKVLSPKARSAACSTASDHEATLEKADVFQQRQKLVGLGFMECARSSISTTVCDKGAGVTEAEACLAMGDCSTKDIESVLDESRVLEPRDECSSKDSESEVGEHASKDAEFERGECRSEDLKSERDKCSSKNVESRGICTSKDVESVFGESKDQKLERGECSLKDIPMSDELIPWEQKESKSPPRKKTKTNARRNSAWANAKHGGYEAQSSYGFTVQEDFDKILARQPHLLLERMRIESIKQIGGVCREEMSNVNKKVQQQDEEAQPAGTVHIAAQESEEIKSGLDGALSDEKTDSMTPDSKVDSIQDNEFSSTTVETECPNGLPEKPMAFFDTHDSAINMLLKVESIIDEQKSFHVSEAHREADIFEKSDGKYCDDKREDDEFVVMDEAESKMTEMHVELVPTEIHSPKSSGAVSSNVVVAVSNEIFDGVLTVEQYIADEVKDVALVEIANDICNDTSTVEQYIADEVKDVALVEISNDICNDTSTVEQYIADEVKDVAFVEISNDICNDTSTLEQYIADQVKDVALTDMSNDICNDVSTVALCIGDQLEDVAHVEMCDYFFNGMSTEEQCMGDDAENLAYIVKESTVESSVHTEKCSAETVEDVSISEESSNSLNVSTGVHCETCGLLSHKAHAEGVALCTCRPAVAASLPNVPCVNVVEHPLSVEEGTDGSWDILQNGKKAIQVEPLDGEVSCSAYDEIALSGCHHVVARPCISQTADDGTMNGFLHRGIENCDILWSGDLIGCGDLMESGTL